MKRINHNYWGVLLLVFSSIASIGQNFSKDIAELNYSYFDLNKKFTSLIVITGDDNEVRSIKSTSVMRGIDDYYMKGEGTEMLIQDGIKIAVDEDMKMVLIDSNAKDLKSSLPLQLFDTLASYYSTIKHSTTGNLEKYHLVPKMGNTAFIEFYFDRHTMLLHKIEARMYDSRKRGYFMMSNTYTYSEIGPSDLPKVSDFFSLTTQQLTPKFSNYQLVNYLND